MSIYNVSRIDCFSFTFFPVIRYSVFFSFYSIYTRYRYDMLLLLMIFFFVCTSFPFVSPHSVHSKVKINRQKHFCVNKILNNLNVMMHSVEWNWRWARAMNIQTNHMYTHIPNVVPKINVAEITSPYILCLFLSNCMWFCYFSCISLLCIFLLFIFFFFVLFVA